MQIDQNTSKSMCHYGFKKKDSQMHSNVHTCLIFLFFYSKLPYSPFHFTQFNLFQSASEVFFVLWLLKSEDRQIYSRENSCIAICRTFCLPMTLAMMTQTSAVYYFNFPNSMEKLMPYHGYFSILFEKITFYTEILTRKVELWLNHSFRS